MRNAIAENDPAIFRTAFAPARVGHVNGFVPWPVVLSQDRDGEIAGVAAENPVGPSRRILRASKSDEQDSAHGDPHDVERYEDLRPAICDLQLWLI